MKTKVLVQNALLICLALIFGYLESLLSLPIPVPGVKLGISNLVILFALQYRNRKEAFLIMFFKTLLSALLFSGFSAFLYSFFGGLFSLFSMYTVKHFCSLSFVGAAGGAAHNIGQLCAAALIFKSVGVFYYLPVLIITGTVLGLLLGTVAAAVFHRLPFSK